MRWHPFMRTLPIILLLTLVMFGCGQNQNHMEKASSNFYTNNEDHFGFLVFDKSQVDTFFEEYLPIQFQNVRIQKAFEKLQKADTANFTTGTLKFSTHTNEPTFSDYDLAIKVLRATNEKNGEKYFPGSVTYLFFFNCLPTQFHNKWTQTRLGDFEFNVTFFNLLRTKCQVFDKHIYGDTGYWDKSIQQVFKHDIFNEITSENAQLIKNCISSDTAFNDDRLRTDKDNFILFLDKVIQNKWRLFLIDKN